MGCIGNEHVVSELTSGPETWLRGLHGCICVNPCGEYKENIFYSGKYNSNAHLADIVFHNFIYPSSFDLIFRHTHIILSYSADGGPLQK